MTLDTNLANNILCGPERTDRGLARIPFADFYGDPCHILESSLEEECAIWLGVEGAPRKMLLTREHMAALIPVFQHFVENGRLPSVGAKAARIA